MSEIQLFVVALSVRKLAICALRECQIDPIHVEVLFRNARASADFTKARDLMLWTLARLAGGRDYEVAATMGLTRLSVINARARMRHQRRNEGWEERTGRFVAFISSDEQLCAALRAAVFEAGHRERKRQQEATRRRRQEA